MLPLLPFVSMIFGGWLIGSADKEEKAVTVVDEEQKAAAEKLFKEATDLKIAAEAQEERAKALKEEAERISSAAVVPTAAADDNEGREYEGQKFASGGKVAKVKRKRSNSSNAGTERIKKIAAHAKTIWKKGEEKWHEAIKRASEELKAQGKL